VVFARGNHKITEYFFRQTQYVVFFPFSAKTAEGHRFPILQRITTNHLKKWEECCIIPGRRAGIPHSTEARYLL
jgi:hypothetical protein